MDLSIPYVGLASVKMNEKAGEFQIIYDADSKLDKLIYFAEHWKEKTINVLFSKEYNYTKCADLIANSGCNNIIAVFFGIPTEEEAAYLHKSNVRFYSLFAAPDLYFLDKLIALGVDSVFIADSLWHQLPIVKNKLGDIKLRMHGDKPGTNWFYPENELEYYTLFIPRPEDYELLENYVDVIQFNTNKPNELSVLFKIWFETHKWDGYIQDIMFEQRNGADFPNSLIQKEFTRRKIECGARCLTGESVCRACKHAVELAWLLQEKGEQFNDQEH